jgi:hypothetical protein
MPDLNPSRSSPYIPSGMSYAEPRRGLALTFGTLLSSQGAGAHRQRPFGPSSGQLAQHMGGSRACQPAATRSVRTRSAAPSAPCRRRDRHTRGCGSAPCCAEPQSPGNPLKLADDPWLVQKLEPKPVNVRVEDVPSEVGSTAIRGLCRLPGGPPCGANRKLRAGSEHRQLGEACQVSLSASPRGATSCCNGLVISRSTAHRPGNRPG